MIHKYKQVIDYPIDIDSFTYDARTFVNNIYIGPQGDLLESVEKFNADYNTNIAVTKNFTLKPGAYDEIKKGYSKHVLRWDMKPRGIDSIFNRIQEYKWRGTNFRQDLQIINNLMTGLKRDGLKWQDNTNGLVDEIDKLKSRINNALEVCRTLYPNIDFYAKMAPITIRDPHIRTRWYGSQGRETFPATIFDTCDMDHAIDYLITFVLYMHKPTMTIHRLRSDGVINKVDVKCTGDLVIVSGMKMLNMISRSWGKDVLPDDIPPLVNTTKYYLEGIYLDSLSLNHHPYISTSSDKYTFDIDQETSNNPGTICTGNMATELKHTMINNQVEAHITYLVQWLSNFYIPQTNPLNRINKLRNFGRNIAFADLASGDNGIESLIGNRQYVAEECDLGHKITKAIRSYGKKRASVQGSHSYRTFLYDIGSEEYRQRIIKYINTIDVKDLPCNDCVYSTKCPQENNIKLFFQDELTEMEEAYISMFLELKEYQSYSTTDNRLHFSVVEELVEDSYRTKIEYEYDILVLSNQIAKSFHEGQTLSYTTPSWLETVKCLFPKSLETLIALSEEENIHEWPLSKLFEYTIKTKKMVVDTPLENDLDLTFENVPEFYDDDQIEDIITRDELTPEELTLRWASTQGGATNL